jgi:outer membrane protein assembly factor BamB
MASRSLVFSSLVLASSVVGVGSFSAFAGCGGEDNGAPSSDASSDAPLFGDVELPKAELEASAGDVCGRRDGLSATASWPLRGACPTRAGKTDRPGPQSGTVKWTLAASVADTSPAVGDLVWVGTESGDVIAVTEAGAIRATFHTSGPIRTSAALDAHGNAVIVGGDGVLYGLRAGPPTSGEMADAGADADAGDGGEAPRSPMTVAFSIAIGASGSSPVIGQDGTIYVGTFDGQLVAVEPGGAKKRWSVTTNDMSGSSPAIGQDGTIYVGSSDHKLHATHADGTSAWALDLGAEVGSPVVGGDGTIYVGTSAGKLHSVSAAGAERWSYATGGAIHGEPAVYAGAVYVGSDDKKLHAVSTQDGKGSWAYETLGAVATPVITTNGTVYVGSSDGRLYAIRPTGTLLLAFNLKGKVRGAPAISSRSALYLTTDNGLVSVSE